MSRDVGKLRCWIAQVPLYYVVVYFLYINVHIFLSLFIITINGKLCILLWMFQLNSQPVSVDNIKVRETTLFTTMYLVEDN